MHAYACIFIYTFCTPLSFLYPTSPPPPPPHTHPPTYTRTPPPPPPPPPPQVKIASDFILASPPGEFNEVFNDVRVLLNDDKLLKEGAAEAFTSYNQDQFTPAHLEEADKDVLITAHGLRDDGKYYDPESKQAFSFDQLRKTTSDVEAAEAPEGPEDFRAAFETEAKAYAKDHYPAGITSVYGKGSKVIVCIEDHKFQPHNYWNGRWRSQWTYDTSSGESEAVLRVQVHYYEDGNVQLQCNKNVSLTVAAAEPSATAKKFFKAVSAAESEYQTAISENYGEMSDTTFKALRRALPVTRSKVDWTKITNYKVGKELSNK